MIYILVYIADMISSLSMFSLFGYFGIRRFRIAISGRISGEMRDRCGVRCRGERTVRRLDADAAFQVRDASHDGPCVARARRGRGRDI
jgi:hypothetical protein